MLSPDQSLSSLAANGIWPPQPGVHLAVLTNDETIIVEVVSLLDDDKIEVKPFKKYELDSNFGNLSLWQDVDTDLIIVPKSSILPSRPQIEIVPSLSRLTRSGRRIVYQVENMDLVNSMTA